MMFTSWDWTIIFQWLNILLIPVVIAVPVLMAVLLVLKIRRELRNNNVSKKDL